MYEVSLAEQLQLKQAKIEVLKEENTVVLEVLPVKRGCGAGAAIVKTTAQWEALSDKVFKRGAILVYSDYASRTDEQGEKKAVPGMKVADGVHAVSQLEFLASSVATNLLTLSEEEMRQILAGGETPDPEPDPPPAPPKPREIMTEDEMLEILNKDSDDPGEVGPGRSNILTEEELLEILNRQ